MLLCCERATDRLLSIVLLNGRQFLHAVKRNSFCGVHAPTDKEKQSRKRAASIDTVIVHTCKHVAVGSADCAQRVLVSGHVCHDDEVMNSCLAVHINTCIHDYVTAPFFI